jgi:spore coat protein JC
MIKDPDIIDPIRFLREREIVHFQRFGETNRAVLSIISSYKQ